MFTRKQLLLLVVTLLTVSNSTYPIFNSATSWFSRSGRPIADNRGTVALVSAGVCALGAVAYFAWKKLTRKPKKLVEANQDPGQPVVKLDAKPKQEPAARKPEPVPHGQRPVQPRKGTLPRQFITDVLNNDIDSLRKAVGNGDLDINAFDNEGNTLLHHALTNFKCNPSYGVKEGTVNLLVRLGIDISHKNNQGYTAYEWANKNGRLEDKKAAILDVLKSN